MPAVIMKIIKKIIANRIEKRNNCFEPSKVPELKREFDALLESDGEPEGVWTTHDRVTDGKPGETTSL